jgi:hypothetical protein
LCGKEANKPELTGIDLNQKVGEISPNLLQRNKYRLI